jgi:hypothetical protein
MSLILLILGILATGMGIVTIGFGIPINEFNLGNTMIVAGTTATAAGLILIGLAAAVEQLTRIAAALRPRAGVRPVQQPLAEPGLAAAIRAPTPQFPVQHPVPAAPPPIQPPVPPAGQVKSPLPPMPPRGPSAKPRSEEHVEEPAAPDLPFTAIERLRATMGRTERKGDDVADTLPEEGAPYIPLASNPAMPRTRPASPINSGGPNPAINGTEPPPAAAVQVPKKPPLDFLFRSRSRAQAADPFDEVWPKRGPRGEPSEAAEPSPVPAGEASPEAAQGPSRAEAPLEAAPDEMRPAAILKSGVVDGMAYTLYADGSIEAQLPQGTVRFGSITELRSHIENSS